MLGTIFLSPVKIPAGLDIHDLLNQGLPFEEAVFKGAMHRVAPVLMTALTAALGMLPLAIGKGAGSELEQPLAIVIVGGMVTSTALTLIVVPALFQVFMRRHAWQHEPGATVGT